MDKFAARRKLLRGSLSAPVVLTVASPAALAQTTFTSCLANGVAETTNYMPPNADNVYYRVAVTIWSVQFENGPEVGPYYVFPASPPFTSLVGLGDPKYYYADAVADPKGNNGTVAKLKSEGGTIKKATNIGTRQAVAYVGPDGALKGYGFPATSGGGAQVMQSCYNSLLMQPQ